MNRFLDCLSRFFSLLLGGGASVTDNQELPWRDRRERFVQQNQFASTIGNFFFSAPRARASGRKPIPPTVPLIRRKRRELFQQAARAGAENICSVA